MKTLESLWLDRTSRFTLQDQLTRQVKELIQRGVLYTDGGMNLTGFLPPDADDVSWSARLTAAGFDVPSLSHYSMKATTPGLVFGFTSFTPAVIGASFERMRRVLKQRS